MAWNRMRSAVAVAGQVVLAALAAVGLALSALAGGAAPPGFPTALLERALAGVIAGRVTAGSAALLPDGIALRDVRVVDPDGHLVLSAGRVRLRADLTTLASREIGLSADLESVEVRMEREPDGSLSLARAFAPPPGPPSLPVPPGRGPGLGLRVSHLAIRDGYFHWERAPGIGTVDVTGIDLDADGYVRRGGAALRVRLAGRAAEPAEGPLSVSAAARLAGDRLEVPVLAAALGDTRLELLGEVDVGTGAFRAAATRLGVERNLAHRLAAGADVARDLGGAAYAASDGTWLTAALEVPRAGSQAPAGSIRAALVLRLGGARRAAGVDLALVGLDPAALVAQAPSGRVSLVARGAAEGRSLSSARGRFAVELAASQLRGVEVGPAELEARAVGGAVEVTRLEARLPGLEASGTGSLGPRGAIGADLLLDANDLARLGEALAALTGAPLPSLTGRMSGRARLSGTVDAPALDATLEAERTTIVGSELRDVRVEAALAGSDARFSVAASAPGLGPDPVSVRGSARIDPDRKGAAVSELSLAWPGAHWELVRPATVRLEPPGVDRLELADGPRRITLEGGLGSPVGGRGQGRTLDVAVRLERLDLSRLPHGLLPADAGLAGELTLSARASGAVRRPDLTADVEVASAEVRLPDGEPATGALRAHVEYGTVEGRPGLVATARVENAVLRGLGSVDSLHAEASLSGSASAPVGEVTLAFEGADLRGYRDVAGDARIVLERERTSLVAHASMAGAEVLAAEGSVGAPLARLADLSARRSASVAATARVPGVTIAHVEGSPVPIAGRLAASLSVAGTLGRPEARLELEGAALEVAGRPLGDLSALLTHEPPVVAVDATLRPAAGGEIRAEGTLTAPEGLLDPAAAGRAVADLRARSDGLDLGFLPALVPGLVRRASGRLTMDLAAAGPLARLRPRGSVRLEGGAISMSGVGEWSEVALVASLGEDAVEVSRLEARQGSGRLSAKLSVRDIGSAVESFDGRLELRNLTLARAGSGIATLDLPVAIRGSITRERVDATVTLEQGNVRLPRRAAGALQPLDGRADVVEEGVAAADEGEAARSRKGGSPRDVRVAVAIPAGLVVKGDKPALTLELTGDTTWTWAGGELGAEGTVTATRGTVEPISGRVFHLERGRVTFPGGPVGGGQVDVVARYDNPAAIVRVAVGNTVAKPSLHFSSEPAMDEASIAMLIATGRTEINVNTSGVGTLTPQEVGAAMASAALSAAFTGLVSDKLPVDQLSVDSYRVRAGKYVTDKLFVGYAYRFEAKPEQGENVNEVKAEYQITPRWHFELRYGDAQAGDASLIWSRNY